MADDLQAIVQRMIDAGEPENNIAAVIQHFHHAASATPSAVTSPESGIGLAAGAVPVAGRLIQEVATNPGVPKAGSILGQIAGGVEGAMKGGPLGAAGGAWAGGKAGWFTGKLAQRLAAPVAKAADAFAPYAEKLAPFAAAQGVNDLAQIAEPNRRDIGVFGIGPSTPEGNGTGAHFGGAGTMSWSDTAKAVRDAVMRRLSGHP